MGINIKQNELKINSHKKMTVMVITVDLVHHLC